MSGGLNEGPKDSGVRFEERCRPDGTKTYVTVPKEPRGVDSKDHFDPDLGGARGEELAAEHAKAAEAAMQVVES